MSSDQRFSLRWNNYQTHLVTAFESLLTGQEFIDVTLGVQGRKLPAHRMLLSACSPYFRELLKDNLCQHPIIVLRDVTYTDMHSLLQFMYNGEVNVCQEQLNSFLKTAESLKIRGLTDTDSENGTTTTNISEPGDRRDETPPQKRQKRSQPFSDQTLPTELPDQRNPGKLSEFEKRDKREGVKQELIELSGQMECEPIVGDEYGSSQAADDFGDSELYEQHGSEYGNDTMYEGGTQAAAAGFNPYMMTFEKPKAFPCPHCEKSYAVEPSLNEHLKVHTGETTCQICKIPQARIATLRRHLRSIHKLSEEEVALMIKANK